MSRGGVCACLIYHEGVGEAVGFDCTGFPQSHSV